MGKRKGVIELVEQVADDIVTEQVDGGIEAGGGDAGNIELVRELARRAYPDAIPELIGGESVEDVMASVEQARAAFARVFAEVSERQAVVRPPVVPAGGSQAPVVDADRLPAAEKLRRGVGARRQSG
ncbi:hypothetical protein BH23CHL4_BH23CHL4_22870 [soil metagenome]